MLREVVEFNKSLTTSTGLNRVSLYPPNHIHWEPETDWFLQMQTSYDDAILDEGGP